MRKLRTKVVAFGMGFAAVLTSSCSDPSDGFQAVDETTSTSITTTTAPETNLDGEATYETMTVCADYSGGSMKPNEIYLGFSSGTDLLSLKNKTVISDSGSTKGINVPTPLLAGIFAESKFIFKAAPDNEMFEYLTVDPNGSFLNQLFTEAGRVKIAANAQGELSIEMPSSQSLRLDITSAIPEKGRTKQILHKDGSKEGQAFGWVETVNETFGTTKYSIDARAHGAKDALMGFNFVTANGGGPVLCQASVTIKSDDFPDTNSVPAVDQTIAL